MKTSQRTHVTLRWFLIMLMTIATYASAASWKEQVLYSFQGSPDGAIPVGGVVFDKSGNFYGATTDGGQYGELGVVYELSPPAKKGDPWTESLIYQFLGKKGYNDGMNPVGGLVIDSSGNQYGTTAYGGTGGCTLLGVLYGCGTVYELSPPQQKGGQWTETILYSFQSGQDGYFPWGTLTFDSKGNLYGATQFGGGKGTTCNPYYQYCGTVFELSPPKQKGGAWAEKVLHSFAGGTDGANPNGGLVLDSKGAIYGTTYAGGMGGGPCGTSGCGTAFRLQPPAGKGRAWTESILYCFRGTDGGEPAAGVVFHGRDALYGTTRGGGGGNYPSGTVFKLVLNANGSWTESLLHSFQDGDDGSQPLASVIFDARGDLCGVASEGGKYFAGTVFRMKPPSGKTSEWGFSVLYAFERSPDGGAPSASLVRDKARNFYSTTAAGGTGTCGYGGCGTVFEVSLP